MKYTFLLCVLISIYNSLESQTLVPYLKKNNTYIYVDSLTMEPIIVKEYKEATLFNSGGIAYVLEAVYDQEKYEGLKYSCINRSGDIVYAHLNSYKYELSCNIEVIHDDFGDFVFVVNEADKYSRKNRAFLIYNTYSDLKMNYFSITKFNQGRLIVSNLNKRANGGSEPNLLYGVIDLKGNEIVTPIYYEIRSYKDGMAAVKTENGWGYIDLNGNEVIPTKFYSVTDFENGKAVVNTKAGEKYLIDKKGIKINEKNVIHSYQYFSNSRTIYFDSRLNGYADVGLRNVKSKKSIPIGKYHIIGEFNTEYAFVKNSNGMGLIDTLFNEVIPPKYDLVETLFYEGLVKVKSLRGYTFVDKKGVECFSPINLGPKQELQNCFGGYVRLINKESFKTIYFDKKGKGFYEK